MNTTSIPGGTDGPSGFGRKIGKLRDRLRWSQDVLAAKMQIRGCDISRDVVANIETNRSIASHKHVFYFAKVFNVSIDELFRP